MGCSIVGVQMEGELYVEGEKVGLITGHAYSILDIIDIGT